MDLTSLTERERINSALENARRDKIVKSFQVKAHCFFGLNR